MRAFIHGLLLWLALSVPMAQAAQVVFINPGRTDEPFWRGHARLMQAAAGDPGLALQLVYAERDPQRLISTARRVLQGAQRPDYLLFVNEYYTGPEILRLGDCHAECLLRIGIDDLRDPRCHCNSVKSKV